MFLILAFAGAAFWTVLGLQMTWGWLTFERLRALPVSRAGSGLVSVIIAARDEEESIEPTLRGLAASTGVNLEIVFVNDRSTDRSGGIAARLEGEIANLRVVHVTDLPERWLGKTHALQVGYLQSHGDWLCFTDADVAFEPDCLSRAVAFAEARGIDHVSLFPNLETTGFWDRLFVVGFAFFFGAGIQPWKAKDPKSSKFCGVGAFNLIRRTAYETLGTHERLRLEIGDDVKLGKLVKLHGLRSDALDGDGLLKVKWQRGGLQSYIRGLEKNAFAGLNFELKRVIAVTIGVAAFDIFPFAGALFLDGGAQWASVWTASFLLAGHIVLTRQLRISPLYAFTHPVAAAILVFTIWRSAWIALRTGAVNWRGTEYPLDLLRKYLV